MSRRRIILYAVWLVLACCLYFFENNTGTRIVLFGSVILPLVSPMRRALFSQDGKETPQQRKTRAADLSNRETDLQGDVRGYLPGDPVNRMHWKLSAKRDELLVRQPGRETEEAEAEKESTVLEKENGKAAICKRFTLCCLAVFLASTLLLLLIPAANRGFWALCNRLFTASEAVNAYAYDRFPVAENQPVWLAVLLLALGFAALLGMTVGAGSRLLALGMLAGCAVFQMYFGLALPGWGNVLLFALFILWMLRRPWKWKEITFLFSALMIVSLAILLAWPGVDPATEAASESARDWLNQIAQHAAGTIQESPENERETRHVHTQSLTAGEGEARADREYRRVAAAEEQISKPHWVDYLKIALLLLLTAAVVVLPFLPFLWLNAQRKKALDARRAFQSDNVSEAICALFQQAVSWLSAMGYSAGNVPCRDWPRHLEPLLPQDYLIQFSQCAAIFEEAAYSHHAMTEDQRQLLLRFFQETETRMLAKADWKQKLRLKYKECLWVERNA